MNLNERMDAAVATLREMERRGVLLSLQGSELRYKAPKGVLTEELISRLRQSRPQLAELLRLRASEAIAAESQLRRRAHTGPVPFSYSQISHWRRYCLSVRRHVRQVASATGLSGPLNVSVLERALVDVMQRHEALRTSVLLRDGMPLQEVRESCGVELRIVDLTDVAPEERRAAVNGAVEAAILDPVDAKVDPLLDVRLLRLDEAEHVLVVAMEHLISDGSSKGIFLRDMLASYFAALAGCPASLPPIPIQFTDYAVWQRAREGTWHEQHGRYWLQRLRGCGRLRFPQDRRFAADRLPPGWNAVPVRIGANLRKALWQWCRRNGTTLALGVFSAYAVAALRWCGATEGIFRYQIDGRVHAEIENTIGYFASGLHLRISVGANDRLIDVARCATHEYCTAHEHADHGLLEAAEPLPDFGRTVAFNWQASSIQFPSAAQPSSAVISCTPLSFENPMMRTLDWDAEPALALFDSGDEVSGSLYFTAGPFSVSTMEQFVSHLLGVVQFLAEQPSTRVSEIPLLS